MLGKLFLGAVSQVVDACIPAAVGIAVVLLDLANGLDVEFVAHFVLLTALFIGATMLLDESCEGWEFKLAARLDLEKVGDLLVHLGGAATGICSKRWCDAQNAKECSACHCDTDTGRFLDGIGISNTY